MGEIIFECPECRAKVSTSDLGEGKKVRCPRCGSKVQIPAGIFPAAEPRSEGTEENGGMGRWETLLLVAAVGLFCSTALASFFAVAATLKTNALEGELTRERAAKERVLADIGRLKAEAQEELQLARAESAKIIAQAEKVKTRVEKMATVEDKRLHEVFGDLHRYREGTNEVKLGYVESFTLYRPLEDFWAVKVKMVNRGHRAVKPDFELHFLNQYGFVTASCDVSWWFDTIAPGETRIEETPTRFRYGDPVYYTVVLR